MSSSPKVMLMKAAAIAAVAAVFPCAAGAQTCEPAFLPTFAGSEVSSTIETAVVFDDGTGPALYIGGSFTTIGGVSVARVARWSGTTWEQVGSGKNGTVRTLFIFDEDGAGPNPPALYAGGDFSGVEGARVSRWNGTAWEPVGAGLNGSVYTFAAFDPDGAGPEPVRLIAGGAFTATGSTTIGRLAYFNGASWVSVHPNTPSAQVQALEVFDHGTGPRLYVGGTFTDVGGTGSRLIAAFDGTSWSAVGGGMPVGTEVNDMAVWNDGTGPALFVTGAFTQAGTLSANRIAKWNGSSWSDLGAGLGSTGETLTVFNDGTGPKLFVGGQFTSAGGQTINRLARWDGANWSDVAGGVNGTVQAIVPFDGSLFIAGSMTTAGSQSIAVSRITRLKNGVWHTVSKGTDNTVQAVTTGNIGQGPELFVGGLFLRAGEATSPRVARWRDGQFHSMGEGFAGTVNTMAVYAAPGEATASLYAGGSFTTLGDGRAANRIARWDGAQWQPVATGVSSTVNDMLVYNGELVVAGSFALASGQQVGRIARWNGTAWAGLGTGANNTVDGLTVYNGELIAVGAFTQAGGVTANRVARWDGSSWAPVGEGASNGVNNSVTAAAVYNGELYVSGSFTQAGTISANRIARWNGTQWRDVGGGLGGAATDLYVFDDGNGPALYATGSFTMVAGQTINRLARWNGTVWEAVSTGLPGNGNAMVGMDTPEGPSLFIGGAFTSAGGQPADRLARYLGCGCPADFNNDGAVTTGDITAFLSAWFTARAGGPVGGADFNGDDQVTTADITAFLSAWFAARAGGC